MLKDGEQLPSFFGNALPKINKRLAATYRDFYASLTPEQLESLGGKPHPSNLTGEATRILKNNLYISEEGDDSQPDQPTYQQGASLTTILSRERDPSDIDADTASPDLIPALIVLEIIRKVLHAWTSAPDRSTRLHGEVLGIALGIPGESVSSLARKYGCTRQAISKRHRSVIKALSLPPNTRMLLARSKAAKVLSEKNIALPTRRLSIKPKVSTNNGGK
jgi:hypothetical protein